MGRNSITASGRGDCQASLFGSYQAGRNLSGKLFVQMMEQNLPLELFGLFISKERQEMVTFKIWFWVLLSSLLPFLAIAWLWKSKAKNKMDWALKVAIVGALALATFIATPWAMTSYYLRYLLIVLFAPAVFLSFRKVKGFRPQALSSTDKKLILIKVIVLLALLPLDAMAVSTYFYAVAPVELAFPLSNGVYYVIQGGNSRLTNPFHRSGMDNREDYALDIVKLNWTGNRATGIYPQGLTSYAMYGAVIYSPCDGEIVEVMDGIADNAIGEVGHSPSNHIVIRCKGVRVTLAHMRSGTFSMQNGQLVKEGQQIAIVGNAGHTSEPHLHMDAVRDSADTALTVTEPVPISFDGRILSVNSIVRR
jgi:hypothetical protein